MSHVKAIRIVHVEDDDAHAKLIHRALQKQPIGFELVRLTDGQAALDYFADEANVTCVDLILLDLNLPKLNGIEVLHRFKSTPLLKMVPVVMLTTSNTESDRSKAYDEYVNSYLVKPISFEDIKSLMEEMLRYWGNLNTRPNPSAA